MIFSCFKSSKICSLSSGKIQMRLRFSIGTGLLNTASFPLSGDVCSLDMSSRYDVMSDGVAQATSSDPDTATFGRENGLGIIGVLNTCLQSGVDFRISPDQTFRNQLTALKNKIQDQLSPSNSQNPPINNNPESNPIR